MLRAKEIDGLLHIEANGILSEQDYDAFVPLFEKVARRKSGTVPMLIELGADFAGWDIAGLWRDIKFDIRHKDQFGRIAIIGDSKWEGWATKLFDTLFRADMQFFQCKQSDEAKIWVRQGGEDEGS